MEGRLPVPYPVHFRVADPAAVALVWRLRGLSGTGMRATGQFRLWLAVKE
jgi:hypothetical protein